MKVVMEAVMEVVMEPEPEPEEEPESEPEVVMEVGMEALGEAVAVDRGGVPVFSENRIVEMLWQRQREHPDQLNIQKIQIVPQSQKLQIIYIISISTTSAYILNQYKINT